MQFVEIDSWCQRLLKQHWPDVPCHGDLKTFNGEKYHGSIDLLTAGYPCQPFSVAGKQKAEEDPRHLWPEVLRVIRESRPRWIICENVEGHVKLGYDSVHTDLESEGYTVWPFVIPASGVGAKHQRKRIWIVAQASRSVGELTMAGKKSESRAGFTNSSNDVSDAQGVGVQGFWASRKQIPPSYEEPKLFVCNSEGCRFTYWEIEPDVGRVVNGIPDRVDRIKGLGNAIVPLIPYLIIDTIKRYEASL